MNLTTRMACATCRRVLTEHRHRDQVEYRHPVVEAPHEVVPVDAGHVRRPFDRCHTCTDDLPVWNYRTGLIQFLALEAGILRTYNDHWHVCYRCAQHIEANDIDALTARCAGIVGWQAGSDEYTQLDLLYRGIVFGREGRTLLTTTTWPAARITVEMLPKVRDRLTGLLRCAADLPEPLNNPGQRQTLASQLDLIPMYWINEEFTRRVKAHSADQPPARITDELLPAQAGLLAWPGPVSGTGQLAAVSWTPGSDGWQLIGYRSIGSALDDDLMPALRHEIGWLLPIHAEHVPNRAALDGSHPLGPLVTTWLLIKQQMAESVPATLPKGTTKAYQRSQRPAPDVRIVQIKPRSDTSGTWKPEAPTGRTRAKPDHRYWVSGHERQQAHGPGWSLHKTIDIEPFLKGDEDLPIKLSSTVRVLGNPKRDGGTRSREQ
ncbi:hypothetical protein [Actinoplanes sp. L3-i22]|uniref:hypothetical protein n=1 Tax=Actinoplanes sp. L3-i22 TaxID=2836373 RepID=UPI001C7966BC|nr:hypothetical protein [Actinoplanes sp. L3-i22]BCY07304.1 hypothetical protein L3i22_023920 [Actinoplanes sp. L3-i22]